MLSGVPTGTSSELLRVLHEMGYGDTLVIGDVNFPTVPIAVEKNHISIRCDGHWAIDMPDVIPQLMPLDSFIERSVTIMDEMEMHRDLECLVWDELTGIAAKYDERDADTVGFLDRSASYGAARDAYAMISTSEAALYACIMIQEDCLQRWSGGILHI